MVDVQLREVEDAMDPQVPREQLVEMKSHSAMNQVIARLLSEDHQQKKGILSLVSSSTAGILGKREAEKTDKNGRPPVKRPHRGSASSSEGDSDDNDDDYNNEEGEEERIIDDTRVSKKNGTGACVTTERGSGPAEKQDIVSSCHVLPSSSSGVEVERAMQRVATRAVVQLFNAVSKHQKDIESKLKEAGKSERKKTKIMSSVDKKDFLGHLKKSTGKPPASQKKKSSSEVQQPMWSVLRDDFTKGSKLKDWDKVEEEGEHSETEDSDD